MGIRLCMPLLATAHEAQRPKRPAPIPTKSQARTVFAKSAGQSLPGGGHGCLAPFPAKHHVHAGRTVMHPHFRDLLDAHLQRALIPSDRLVTVDRAGEPRQRAGLPLACTETLHPVRHQLTAPRRFQSSLTARSAASPCPARGRPRAARASRSRLQAALPNATPRATARRISFAGCKSSRR